MWLPSTFCFFLLSPDSLRALCCPLTFPGKTFKAQVLSWVLCILEEQVQGSSTLSHLDSQDRTRPENQRWKQAEPNTRLVSGNPNMLGRSGPAGPEGPTWIKSSEVSSNSYLCHIQGQEPMWESGTKKKSIWGKNTGSALGHWYLVQGIAHLS